MFHGDQGLPKIAIEASNKNYNNHIKNKNSNNTNVNYLSDKTVHTLKLQT